MKTTIELPDLLLRQAKAAAAHDGKSLKEFFTEAIADKLQRRSPSTAVPSWEKAFGGLKDLHRENMRIDRIIQEEFGKIDEEEWRGSSIRMRSPLSPMETRA